MDYLDEKNKEILEKKYGKIRIENIGEAVAKPLREQKEKEEIEKKKKLEEEEKKRILEEENIKRILEEEKQINKLVCLNSVISLLISHC